MLVSSDEMGIPITGGAGVPMTGETGILITGGTGASIGMGLPGGSCGPMNPTDTWDRRVFVSKESTLGLSWCLIFSSHCSSIPRVWNALPHSNLSRNSGAN
jgi:hypothetical protein